MLKIQHITRTAGSRPLVNDVSLHVAPGECLSLFGPSGSGKTTLLRLIAGLDAATSGTIHINGQLASDPRVVLKPSRRHIGMVFQDLALWPHMTASDHLRFMMTPNGSDSRAKAAALLDAVGLNELHDRKPHQLSGGEQQRLALARALAGESRILLLDEPFSNLQIDLRKRLLKHVRERNRVHGITIVYVTHTPDDLPGFAHRVALMEGGRVRGPIDINEFCEQFGLERPTS